MKPPSLGCLLRSLASSCAEMPTCRQPPVRLAGPQRQACSARRAHLVLWLYHGLVVQGREAAALHADLGQRACVQPLLVPVPCRAQHAQPDTTDSSCKRPAAHPSAMWVGSSCLLRRRKISAAADEVGVILCAYTAFTACPLSRSEMPTWKSLRVKPEHRRHVSRAARVSERLCRQETPTCAHRPGGDLVVAGVEGGLAASEHVGPPRGGCHVEHGRRGEVHVAVDREVRQHVVDAQLRVVPCTVGGWSRTGCRSLQLATYLGGAGVRDGAREVGCQARHNLCGLD